MQVLFLGMSLFMAALAVWLIITLVGLLRLRMWARYSVLVFGGAMAVCCGLGALTSLATPWMMRSLPNQPGLDPTHSQAFFYLGAAFYAFFAFIGIILLIYFNFAATRAEFLQHAEISSTPPNTSTGRNRPTAITVIGWMFLVGGIGLVPYIFLPFPAFLAGYVFRGLASHLLYLVFAGVSASIGYGLLRLYNSARIALYAWLALSLLNMLVIVTPWGYGRMFDYLQAITMELSPGSAAYPNPFLSRGYLSFCFILCLLFTAILMVLLHRHRRAFTPLPPAPPLHDHSQPLAG
jgi:hypothetical protein